MTFSKQQIDVAVAWWCKDIINPGRQNRRREENWDGGQYARNARVIEHSKTGIQAALALGALPQADAEDAARFAVALRSFLENCTNDSLTLSSDYAAWGALLTVLDAAKLPVDATSWKTSMVLLPDGSVRVACGYGKLYQVLLAGGNEDAITS